MDNKTIYSSYLFPHYANKGKQEKLRQVLVEYRKTAKDLADYLWGKFFKHGKFPHKKSLSIKHIPSKLSEK